MTNIDWTANDEVIKNTLEKSQKDLLEVLLDRYTSDILIERYREMFDALFKMSDAIVQMDSEEYIAGDDLFDKSALHLLDLINEAITKTGHTDQIKNLHTYATAGGRIADFFDRIERIRTDTRFGTMESLRDDNIFRYICDSSSYTDRLGLTAG